MDQAADIFKGMMRTGTNIIDEAQSKVQVRVPYAEEAAKYVRGILGSPPSLALSKLAVQTQLPEDKLIDCSVKEVFLRPPFHDALQGVRIDDLESRLDGHVRRVSLDPGLIHADKQIDYSWTQSKMIDAFHYHLDSEETWFFAKGKAKVVLIDLRVDSPTFGLANTIICGQSALRMIFIPRGVAHGYLSLSDTDLISFASTYDPKSSDEYRVSYDALHFKSWEMRHRRSI